MHQNKVPSEVVDAPSLETSQAKAKLEEALSNF